jgi:hypothetical protein
MGFANAKACDKLSNLPKERVLSNIRLEGAVAVARQEVTTRDNAPTA